MSFLNSEKNILLLIQLDLNQNHKENFILLIILLDSSIFEMSYILTVIYHDNSTTEHIWGRGWGLKDTFQTPSLSLHCKLCK